jgi:hypothetical protein
MSKANRVKGKFNPSLGYRERSAERIVSLYLRSEPVGDRHKPTPSLGVPKITKTQRKLVSQLKKLNKGTDEMHPLARKAERSEVGYGIIVGLVSSVTRTPEQDNG